LDVKIDEIHRVQSTKRRGGDNQSRPQPCEQNASNSSSGEKQKMTHQSRRGEKGVGDHCDGAQDHEQKTRSTSVPVVMIQKESDKKGEGYRQHSDGRLYRTSVERNINESDTHRNGEAADGNATHSFISMAPNHFEYGLRKFFEINREPFFNLFRNAQVFDSLSLL
jgi:hypothetical protein